MNDATTLPMYVDQSELDELVTVPGPLSLSLPANVEMEKCKSANGSSGDDPVYRSEREGKKKPYSVHTHDHIEAGNRCVGRTGPL